MDENIIEDVEQFSRDSLNEFVGAKGADEDGEQSAC